MVLVACESEDYYEVVARIDGKDFLLDSDSINLISQYDESLEKSYIASYDEYIEEGFIESEIKEKRRERFRILKEYELEKAIYEELTLKDALESGKVRQEEVDKMSANDRIALISDHREALKKRFNPGEDEIDKYIEENKARLNYIEVMKFSFDDEKDGEIFYEDLKDDGKREEVLRLINGIDKNKDYESIIPEIKKIGNYRISSDSLVTLLEKESETDWIFIPFGNDFNKQIESSVEDLEIGQVTRPIKLEKNWALGFTSEVFILRSRIDDPNLIRDEVKALMEKEYLNDLLKGLWEEASIEILI